MTRSLVLSFLFTVLAGMALIACGGGGGSNGGGGQPPPELELAPVQGSVGTLPSGLSAAETRVYTAFSQAVPAPDGSFTVEAPRGGVQVVWLCRSGSEERLLAAVSAGNRPVILDPMSTAVSLVFESPGVTVLDPARVEAELERIRALPATGDLAAALRDYLNGAGSRQVVTERRTAAVMACLERRASSERAALAVQPIDAHSRSGLMIVSQRIVRPGVLELEVQNDRARFVELHDHLGHRLARLSSKHFVGLLDAAKGPERKTVEVAIGEHPSVSLLAYGPGSDYAQLDPAGKARAREALQRTVVFDLVLPTLSVFAGVGGLIRQAPETVEQVLFLLTSAGDLAAALDDAVAHGDWLGAVKAVVAKTILVLQDNRGLLHGLFAELGAKRVAAWVALSLTLVAEVWQAVAGLGQLGESVLAWKDSRALETWLIVNEPPGLGVDTPSLQLAPGTSATLRAQGGDPEQMELTYTWRQVAGAPLGLSATTGKEVVVTGSTPTAATLELTASDGVHTAGPVQVQVQVIGPSNTPPPTPTDLAGSYDASRGWIYLTWRHPGGPGTAFEIYWGTDSSVSSGSEALTATTTLDYGHTGVLPGVTYWYRVRARNAQGVSELGGVIGVRVP